LELYIGVDALRCRARMLAHMAMPALLLSSQWTPPALLAMPLEAVRARLSPTLPIVPLSAMAVQRGDSRGASLNATDTIRRPHGAFGATLLAISAVLAVRAGAGSIARRRRRGRLCFHAGGKPSFIVAAALPAHNQLDTLGLGNFKADDIATHDPPRPLRVRFAPSPTGVLHVGGARTALFNFLFARSSGGQLVLRIEDTDTARSTPESEAAIIEGLKWCGIAWDEGPDSSGPHSPYRQSERIQAGVYQVYLDRLLDMGCVYRCFITEQELDQMRRDAENRDQAFIVSSPWATASEAEVRKMIEMGEPFVYRFRLPRDRTVKIDDLILGEVSWDANELGGDFVIMRSNGIPMYNFSVVIDDALMEISHVLRAQEHLSNTPKQVLLYEALGLEAPLFGHMPLVLAPDRSKLSKRYGAVAVSEYQRLGYLPAAVVNYLAQLGWNDGTNKEIYEMAELVESFEVERMSKVAAIFDVEKLRWVNKHHIRRMDDQEAQKQIGAELVRQGVVRKASGDFVSKASVLLRERLGTLSAAGKALKALLGYPIEEFLATEAGKKCLQDSGLYETARLLLQATDLESICTGPDGLLRIARSIGEARGVSKRELWRPLRICLTGCDAGPSLRAVLEMMDAIDDNLLCEYVSLDRRIQTLGVRLGLL